MSFSIDLSQKTVLVTGGVSGIGLDTALAFAEAGAKVITCAELAEDHPLVSAFRQHAQFSGNGGSYYRCNLTDASAISQLVRRVEADGYEVDIIVSNAGKNVFQSVHDCDQSTWDFNQQLNLQSHWLICKAFKPMLERKGEGVIIIMTSNHAYSSMQGCFPYSVAKAGLLALVRAMAIEWAPSIRTVGIAPGFIDTPGNQSWFDSFDDPAMARQKVIDLHPVKRLGTAEEIGGWCVFLSSRYASFANGTTYLIDGGRSALMQD